MMAKHQYTASDFMQAQIDFGAIVRPWGDAKQRHIEAIINQALRIAASVMKGMEDHGMSEGTLPILRVTYDAI